jgi:hypothetical protein
LEYGQVDGHITPSWKTSYSLDTWIDILLGNGRSDLSMDIGCIARATKRCGEGEIHKRENPQSDGRRNKTRISYPG